MTPSASPSLVCSSTRPDAFGLGALHHRLEALFVQAEHLRWGLDYDRELIMILSPIDAGPVRGRANLDHEDRSVRQRRDLHHAMVAHTLALDELNLSCLRYGDPENDVLAASTAAGGARSSRTAIDGR